MDLDQSVVRSHPIEERKEYQFRARVVDYGLLMNHKLQQVPFDDQKYLPDYSLTYESFLYYFGGGLLMFSFSFFFAIKNKDSQKAASEYFERYWKVFFFF
jgi:hypothetical protein